MVVSLLIDRLGLGQPGFGESQRILLLAGLAILAASLAARWRRNPPAARPSQGQGQGPEPETRGARALPALRRRYVAAAVLLLNTLVLFFCLNLLLLLGFGATDAAGWTTREPARGLLRALAVLRLVRLAANWSSEGEISALKLGDDELAKIYPRWTRADVARLLRETRERPLGYRAFSQFGELPYRGRFVKVSAHGYRESRGQGPWPMAPRAFNVWGFGGSTTFGYGLPDDETVPSCLQAYLAEKVGDRAVAAYNFGHAYYYSSQELMLFYRLLTSESVLPDVVIFIDGINEHYIEPFYSQALRTFMESPYLAPYLSPHAAPAGTSEAIVSRYFMNKKLIEAWCATAGARALFVWQPSPLWKYDLRFHLFRFTELVAEREDGRLMGTSPLYAHMEQYLGQRARAPEPGFLSLAELQVGVEEPLYVDHVHYTAAFSRRIAEQIGQRIVEGASANPGSSQEY